MKNVGVNAMFLKDGLWSFIIMLGAATTIIHQTPTHPDATKPRKKEVPMYLSIDPGDTNVGWAKFSEDGTLRGFGTVHGKQDKIMEWLESGEVPKVLIIEGYFVNRFKHRQWSRARTAELIGAIKDWARRSQVRVVEQRNTDLSIGLRFAGFYSTYYDTNTKKLKKHVDDEIAALAHGYYYLIKNGVINRANEV